MSRGFRVVAGGLLQCLAIAAMAAEPMVTVVKAGRLIDGLGSVAKTNQVIVIRGDRIVSVGAAGTIPPGARVIDLSDATVLPGLIDAHTHTFLQGEDQETYDHQLLFRDNAFRALRAGNS